MITNGVQILDPETGVVVRTCRGPPRSGACPFAGRNGVVPGAGHFSSAAGDRRFWPMPVPSNYRHCELTLNAEAVACLTEAETCRATWQAGADRETERVVAKANAQDPRYKKMTPQQLETGLWRWRLSTSAIQLSKSEEKQRERPGCICGSPRCGACAPDIRAGTGP